MLSRITLVASFAVNQASVTTQYVCIEIYLMRFLSINSANQNLKN
ncbi:hypothetical protein GMMP1_140048 [Candidatus Magnetomoraceae bacterium gMMP-1]